MCSSMTGSISVVHTGILQLWASTRHIPQHRKITAAHHDNLWMEQCPDSVFTYAASGCCSLQYTYIMTYVCTYSVGGGEGRGRGMCPHLNTLGNGLQLLGSELLKGAALNL